MRAIAWEDLAPPARARLTAAGVTASAFPALIDRLQREHASRVREGDLDHLVFYALQSTHFTNLPSIEPALSAKTFVEELPPLERDALLQRGTAPARRVPAEAQSRFSALLRALDSSDRDPRIAYFRTLVQASFPDRRDRERALGREYLRVMRFLYQKEFIAQRSAHASEKVEQLYESRGLSTDTAVEAGYLVYLGLGIVKSLEPERRVRRVLIIGPGMDLAPRTGLNEAGPPESYQPWAVMDALLALGLSRAGDLEIVGADINPRVVKHLQRSGEQPPVLTLVSGVRESASVRFTDDYRDYFARLGSAIAADAGGTSAHRSPGPEVGRTEAGELRKVVRVRPELARAVSADLLDVVTERLDGATFDLAIATNILPYFDDRELTLAMSNIAAMLAPGGMLLHNEARPVLQDIAQAVHLPQVQSRHAVIATVRGAPAPLFDSIWIHTKR